MLEIDRYALSRAAQLQTDILAHYEVYEFQPVVSKLQIYCSEDLGSFYLDILKDRLYTTAPNSLARRSAQTALSQITQAMLRWMAPFLSFTAEEAWTVVGQSESIFMETFAKFDAPDEKLLVKWGRIRQIRDLVNKKIEALRANGTVGSSLQSRVWFLMQGKEHESDLELLKLLGDELKYVLIVSHALATDNRVDIKPTSAGQTQFEFDLQFPDELRILVESSTDLKCERCWHYRDDVGHDPAHPSICGRCTNNLFGAGEERRFA